ncbi:MAG: sensor histidine kinase [Chloroflexota bacterium]
MAEPSIDVKRQIAGLIAMIAHDLRGQVTAIKGFSQLALRRAGPSSEVDGYLSVTIAEANRMAALIDDLVLFSQIEVQPTIRVEPIDLREVLRAATERIEHLGIVPDLAVETEAESLVAWCDPTLTTRALALVIRTACRYQAGSGPLAITIRRERGETIVAVRSTSSLAADKLRALRRVIGVVDDDPADEISPSGLGLYMSHRLIARQEGRIWIEQSPDRGTTFGIALPGDIAERETSSRGDR